MPILKNSVINQILDSLSYGDYCREDFTVEFPEKGSTLVSILFTAAPKYTFKVTEDYASKNIYNLFGKSETDRKEIIKCRMAPSQYKNEDIFEYDEIDEALSQISSWVNYIKYDLINAKSATDWNVDDVTKNFQESINQNIDDPESYFSEDEINDFREKLSDLQERITTLESKFTFTDEDKKKVNDVIDKTKHDIVLYTKGVWYKTAGTKIIRVVKDVLKTKEGRTVLLEMTKKLLSNV